VRGLRSKAYGEQIVPLQTLECPQQKFMKLVHNLTLTSAVKDLAYAA
jgi:hypothetical protein